VAIVRVNPRLEAELTGSANSGGPLEHALGEVADQIARRAQQLARREYYRTGDYTRGIRAEHGLDEHGELVGRVVAADWKSHWAEFGWKSRTGGERARHILARGAEQAGYRVLGAGLLGGAISASSGRRALPRPRRRAITSR